MMALTYAMDSVLYMTTGMLDRHDEDIQLETAICKVFCSEMGWRVVNDAVQIMGGESYMTENEVERIFRDSRINTIVEGANEVMQSYIFAYGGKDLAESMLGVKDALAWDKELGFGPNVRRMLRNGVRPTMMRAGVPLATELYLGMRKRAPKAPDVHVSLQNWARRLTLAVRQHSHEFKLAAKREEEKIVTRQVVQARLADAAMWLHAWACTLSKLDMQLREADNRSLAQAKAEQAAAEHFMDMAQQEIHVCYNALYNNADDTMRVAAAEALAWIDTLPNSNYVIPERSPVAAGTGKTPSQDGIKQFPGAGPAAQPGANAPHGGVSRTPDRQPHASRIEAAQLAGSSS
jgi:hypothetical protein